MVLSLHVRVSFRQPVRRGLPMKRSRVPAPRGPYRRWRGTSSLRHPIVARRGSKSTTGDRCWICLPPTPGGTTREEEARRVFRKPGADLGGKRLKHQRQAVERLARRQTGSASLTAPLLPPEASAGGGPLTGGDTATAGEHVRPPSAAGERSGCRASATSSLPDTPAWRRRPRLPAR